MTEYVLKPKGNEANVTATNTAIGNATLVRVINPSTALAIITLAAGGTQYANISILPSTEVLIQKASTDTLSSSNNLVLATAVAYRD